MELQKYSLKYNSKIISLSEMIIKTGKAEKNKIFSSVLSFLQAEEVRLAKCKVLKSTKKDGLCVSQKSRLHHWLPTFCDRILPTTFFGCS
jgi:hypothetical protein